MKKALFLAAVAATLTPALASAQMIAALRAGYAHGLGDVAGGTDGATGMSDWNKGQAPVQLDLLADVDRQLHVGAYVAYGWGIVGNAPKDACAKGGVACSGQVWRMGLEATYTFAPTRSVTPWAGLGVGYEWNRLAVGHTEATLEGWELANLQLGGDFRIDRHLRFGPFAMWSLGKYAKSRGDVDGDLAEKTFHQWIQLGVRGAIDL